MRFRSSMTLMLAFMTAIAGAQPVRAQAGNRTAEVSLDSLLNTRISTASKYLQTSAEAAASVTIVSADEIRQLGYTNLLEVLESVPGMYASNDRNYPYLGTRGFGRPSDYNNRILVLLDGHTLNEQVWGGAPVGSDLPINLDAVERLEVVRGPGSALYGTSAMFAVINIVTKSATQVSGTVVSGRLGSGLQRQFGALFGHELGHKSAFTLSALATGSNGNTLYYPEFSSAENPRGAVRHLDWENGGSVLGSLVTGALTTRAGYRIRSKGVPTGAYEMLFGDTRAKTVDESMWADISAHKDIGARYHLSARAYADRNLYHGVSPYSPTSVYTDHANSSNVGSEAMVVWDATSRNRLTVGAEVRRMFIANYFGSNTGENPEGVDSPYTVTSLLAQDELEVTTRLKLVGGIRMDKQVNRPRSLAPRFALVATPDAATTVKLLYGEAFRAPSVAEGVVQTDFYERNYSLRSERIATHEVVVERRVAPALLLGASGYRYVMHNLIEQVQSDTTAGIRYDNRMPVEGRGLELSVNAQPTGSPLALRGWYVIQQTHDDSTHTRLTNSPQHTANASITARSTTGARAAVSLRYESGRSTLSGGSTSAFVRTDVNIGYAPTKLKRLTWANDLDVWLRIGNILNTRYAVPGGLEHVQQSIQQNGRTFSLSVRREF